MKLEGKTAIITGASRGIGKALALAFAKEGASVVIAARTEQEGKLPGTIHQTADEIRSAGGKVLAVRCDVTNEEDVEAMIAKALDAFGRIDILVNNAAVAVRSPLTEMTLKRWNLVMAVNMTGTFLCTKAVIPAMIKQGGGSIINTSSGVRESRSGAPSGMTYIVAKAAIEQFTYMASAELSRYNIAVNCYKPARGVLSEGVAVAFPPDYDTTGWGGPENMVKAALFLAVQDAQGVTATVATDQEYISWHNL
jgi:citronellol/citronellal dehydrogenase